MKAIDLKKINWEELQKKHDDGVFLRDLGVSIKTINKAVALGLFKKKKLVRKWSDLEKKEISERRKKFLKENPDKHPWRNNKKFVSEPCEYLKRKLVEKGYFIEEEVMVSTEKNYSVDILIPDRHIIIEVNGNQHYNKDGTLQEYYQNRHNYIKSLGWVVIEIHYSLVYNLDLVFSLIEKENVKSCNLPFFRKEKKHFKKYKNQKDYHDTRKYSWEKNNLKYVNDVINSDIDFSKFGWVNKVALIINQKPPKVNMWMKRIMPDFYEKNCFKKRS